MSQDSPPHMPRRVIDVGAWDDFSQPQLLETKGQQGSYVALSHRWGPKMVTTTKATLADRQICIPLDAMSNLFRETIYLMKKLCQRYLWIDSLCIIQDSDEDWQTEAAKMKSYYRSALSRSRRQHHMPQIATVPYSSTARLCLSHLANYPCNFQISQIAAVNEASYARILARD